jgi:hypothetical protein
MPVYVQAAIVRRKINNCNSFRAPGSYFSFPIHFSAVFHDFTYFYLIFTLFLPKIQ